MAQIDDLPPLREVIRRHDLRAKKSLGQNFLLDLNLTARIARAAGDLRKRREAAAVALDRDDALGAGRQDRSGQSARAWPDLEHAHSFERAGGPRHPACQVEVEEKVLSERFPWQEPMRAHHLPQRRQLVDLAHRRDRAAPAASRAAKHNAAIRLSGRAMPLPAMSNAVP